MHAYLLISPFNSAVLQSAGAVNHYASQLVATALRRGWIQEHVKRIKQDLQVRSFEMNSFISIHIHDEFMYKYSYSYS